MNFIETKTFKLAVYINGELNSSRLAVVTPGRLDSKDYISLTSLVDMLASEGFLALSFDPPGTWDSAGDINLYTTTNIIKAIDEIITYFGDRPSLLLGHSRGGSNSMLAGTANNNVIGIVSIMSRPGPSNVDTPKKGSLEPVVSFRDLPPGSIRTMEQKKFSLPIGYFIDQQNYDASEKLKTSKVAKLFFYGKEDKLVSPESVKKCYSDAHGPKLIYGLNSEHDYRLHPEIIEEVNNVVKDFITTNKLNYP